MTQEWSPFRAYTLKRHLLNWQDGLTFIIFLAGIIWFYIAARNLPTYQWNWKACLQFFLISLPDGSWRPGLLLQGLFTTLRVGFWSFIFALIAGSLLGFFAVHKKSWIALAYQTFINTFRNTPPLILLFCVYFIVGNLLPISVLEETIRQMPNIAQTAIHTVFAPAGQVDKMIAAIIALGLYQGAYIAEIIRGAIESVPAGQWDAGFALGFGHAQIMRFIILPQGLNLALPALTGQCISTFKESALASLISLPDLTFESLEIMATTSMTFEVWFSTVILYLMLGMICAVLGNVLEKHYSWHFK